MEEINENAINNGCKLLYLIQEYYRNIRNLPVKSVEKEGAILKKLPSKAPMNPEDFEKILEDFINIIMPSITHWQAPNFHAYFPTGSSWPSIFADMLSDTLGCMGFSWISCPAYTELEVVMMDWLCKLLELPKKFLYCKDKSGGVIQNSASDSSFVIIIGLVLEYESKNPSSFSRKNLTVYSSIDGHSSIEKACKLAGVTFKKISTDKKNEMEILDLKRQMEFDVQFGCVPLLVIATLGTTNTCAFDDIECIGTFCNERSIWLHVDAAYAGSAFICPEFRYLMKGIEKANSFNFNPHKWMMVSFDCSALWLDDTKLLIDNLDISPPYLKAVEDNSNMPNYRHISLANYFAQLVKKDERFEVPFPHQMGLVCFRPKGANEITIKLLKEIESKDEVFILGTKIKHLHIIRFSINSAQTNKKDVEKSWNVIRKAFERMNESFQANHINSIDEV